MKNSDMVFIIFINYIKKIKNELKGNLCFFHFLLNQYRTITVHLQMMLLRDIF